MQSLFWFLQNSSARSCFKGYLTYIMIFHIYNYGIYHAITIEKSEKKTFLI